MQKVNDIYPPLIFFNLLSSLFSSAALSEPPTSLTSPGVVACSPQTSTHLLLFAVYICLLVAAELILLQYVLMPTSLSALLATHMFMAGFGSQH